MRTTFSFLIFVVLFQISCNLDAKINKESESDYVEVVDTQLAEIGPDRSIPVLKKDSTGFLKFWKTFSTSIENNDTVSIIKHSLDSIDFRPENDNIYYDSPEEIPQSIVPISEFINYSKLRLFKTDLGFERTRNSELHVGYYKNAVNKNIISNIDSPILTYSVLLYSKEQRGNYELRKYQTIQFIKTKKGIKLSRFISGINNTWF